MPVDAQDVAGGGQLVALVTAGVAVAVVPTGTGVSTTGAACSPPQATRTLRSPRHSSSTAEAIAVPVGLPHNNFTAPFFAPGTVASMTRPVHAPGVPVLLHRYRWLAVPRGSADGKKTRPRERA